jgi:hypothetical protein
MNTLPQAFDARPVPQVGLSVSKAPPQPRPREPKLTLVVDHPDALAAAVLQPATPARPYSLEGRRHLASVPARDLASAAGAQAPSVRADNPQMAPPWARRRLEPLAFALVLLVSVAALAVATRAG